jgi:hypothetical protein
VLGGEGGWDCVALDTVGHRLFITRQTRVMVNGFDIEAQPGGTAEAFRKLPGAPLLRVYASPRLCVWVAMRCTVPPTSTVACIGGATITEVRGPGARAVEPPLHTVRTNRPAQIGTLFGTLMSRRVAKPSGFGRSYRASAGLE